jgi:hypothetical protein
MIIIGRRIRSLEKHFASVKKHAHIMIGITDLTRFKSKLHRIGFSTVVNAGEAILPPLDFGPVSSFNADGKHIIHRDRPKETCYRMIDWHWQEWRGRHDRVERSKMVDVPYKRYPRTFIPPPSVELTIAVAATGDTILVTNPVAFTRANTEMILHRINLLLEIFGESSVLTDDLRHIFCGPLRRLNWHVLPPGKMPWKRLQTHVNPIISEAPVGNQAIISDRLETVNGHGPDFVAIGRAGFKGYVVFGFPKKDMYELESIYHGNATYVFNDNWEKLSQMTKAEILDQNLQRDRIIHRVSWYTKIGRLLR